MKESGTGPLREDTVYLYTDDQHVTYQVYENEGVYTADVYHSTPIVPSVVIPETISGIAYHTPEDYIEFTNARVTSIISVAFEGANLFAITIPNSIIDIQHSAFSGCYNLIEVHNLSNLPIVAGSTDYGNIGFYAKRICSGDESYLHSTEDGFIFYDDGIDDICLMRYIGNKTNLTLPLTYNEKSYDIYSYAFYNQEFITDITIPNSVTSIGDSAFRSCRSLTNIIIPNSITTIGENAFKGCRSITNITIPNSITSIENYVFSECRSLTNIIIPNSVTVIRENAFSYCDSLTNIIIPNSVNSIEDYAFFECDSLTRVFLPSSITTLGSYIFSTCTSLDYIQVNKAYDSELASKLPDYATYWAATDAESIYYNAKNKNIKNKCIEFYNLIKQIIVKEISRTYIPKAGTFYLTLVEPILLDNIIKNNLNYIKYLFRKDLLKENSPYPSNLISLKKIDTWFKIRIVKSSSASGTSYDLSLPYMNFIKKAYTESRKETPYQRFKKYMLARIKQLALEEQDLTTPVILVDSNSYENFLREEQAVNYVDYQTDAEPWKKTSSDYDSCWDGFIITKVLEDGNYHLEIVQDDSAESQGFAYEMFQNERANAKKTMAEKIYNEMKAAIAQHIRKSAGSLNANFNIGRPIHEILSKYPHDELTFISNYSAEILELWRNECLKDGLQDINFFPDNINLNLNDDYYLLNLISDQPIAYCFLWTKYFLNAYLESRRNSPYQILKRDILNAVARFGRENIDISTTAVKLLSGERAEQWVAEHHDIPIDSETPWISDTDFTSCDYIITVVTGEEDPEDNGVFVKKNSRSNNNER